MRRLEKIPKAKDKNETEVVEEPDKSKPKDNKKTKGKTTKRATKSTKGKKDTKDTQEKKKSESETSGTATEVEATGEEITEEKLSIQDDAEKDIIEEKDKEQKPTSKKEQAIKTEDEGEIKTEKEQEPLKEGKVEETLVSTPDDIENVEVKAEEVVEGNLEDEVKAEEVVEGNLEDEMKVDEEVEVVVEDVIESESELEVAIDIDDASSEVEELEKVPEITAEPDSSDVDKLEARVMDYNDFVPTEDTITVITHLDVDGVLCVAAIIKMLYSKKPDNPDLVENKLLRVFFTSPTKIFSTFAKSIPDLNKIDENNFLIGQLYICDLPLQRDTLLGSSLYDSVKWFDHHEVDPGEQFDSEIENIELIIDPTAESATAILCSNFKLDIDLGQIADEIDTNNVKSDPAKRIREIVGALRLKYSGTKLKKMLYDFAKELAINIDNINNEIYNTIIDDYNKWIDGFNKYVEEKLQSFKINDHKIGILEAENAAPVYAIYDNLREHSDAPFDVIAVMIHKYFRIGKDRNNKFKNKRYTKLEFRTHTDHGLLDLAKLFGGGGHKFASGATVMDGIDNEELLKTIESYYSTPNPPKE